MLETTLSIHNVTNIAKYINLKAFIKRDRKRSKRLTICDANKSYFNNLLLTVAFSKNSCFCCTV